MIGIELINRTVVARQLFLAEYPLPSESQVQEALQGFTDQEKSLFGQLENGQGELVAALSRKHPQERGDEFDLLRRCRAGLFDYLLLPAFQRSLDPVRQMLKGSEPNRPADLDTIAVQAAIMNIDYDSGMHRTLYPLVIIDFTDQEVESVASSGVSHIGSRFGLSAVSQAGNYLNMMRRASKAKAAMHEDPRGFRCLDMVVARMETEPGANFVTAPLQRAGARFLAEAYKRSYRIAAGLSGPRA